MKRILLTGMSGTGKSAVIRELVARGYKAVDTDDGWCEPQPDGRQMWREGAIQALLSTEDAEVLFVAGCEENQAKFHAQFHHIILLSAPVETLIEKCRLAWVAKPSHFRPAVEVREPVWPRGGVVSDHADEVGVAELGIGEVRARSTASPTPTRRHRGFRPSAEHGKRGSDVVGDATLQGAEGRILPPCGAHRPGIHLMHEGQTR